MPPPTSSRQNREREIVAATRRLFDERGMQDAPIEEIAKAVGIARGLIYRHFSSKEELFVLTVTDYLDELDDVLREAAAPRLEPRAQLEAGGPGPHRVCPRHPALPLCRLSLL